MLAPRRETDGASGYRRMVARPPRSRPQAARSAASSEPPIRSCATPRCRPTKTTGPNSISCPAGSRLRYLHDPATARAHFAHIDDGSVNPIVLARANYWRGRAAEAIGDKARYAGAATRPPPAIPPLITASLHAPGSASTRLNCEQRSRPIRLHAPARSDELVRAADMLYAVGERDLVLNFVTDLAEQSTDAADAGRARRAGRRAATMLAPCCRSAKLRSRRGFALDHYAFPDDRNSAAQPDRSRRSTAA